MFIIRRNKRPWTLEEVELREFVVGRGGGVGSIMRNRGWRKRGNQVQRIRTGVMNIFPFAKQANSTLPNFPIDFR
jgi:hypothetical protein